MNVPAGVEEGQQMRLAGQGEAGDQRRTIWRFVCGLSSRSKVISLIVKVQKSTTTLPLSFVQAALGDEINITNCPWRCEIEDPCWNTNRYEASVYVEKALRELRGGATWRPTCQM